MRNDFLEANLGLVNLSINLSLKINNLFYTFETLRISMGIVLSNIAEVY